MAANFGIIQQGAGLEVLEKIIDLVKNPALIKEAQETYRKEIAITDAEEAKANEARELIGCNAKVQADLKKAQDDLTAAQAAHTDNMKALSDREARVSAMEIETKAKVAAQADVVTAQANEKKQLDAARTAHAQDVQMHADKVAKDMADIAAGKEKNSTEAKRLSDLETAISLRLEKVKLREQAADM